MLSLTLAIILEHPDLDISKAECETQIVQTQSNAVKNMKHEESLIRGSLEYKKTCESIFGLIAPNFCKSSKMHQSGDHQAHHLKQNLDAFIS